MAHDDDSHPRRDLQQHLLTATAPDPMAVRAPIEHSPLSGGESLKHYEIIRKLGQGGMGAVFLARDTKLGRLVAIKILLEHGGEQGGRFLIEARATARCKHENIVVIYEVDEHRGVPYMVLEHLEGRTLREWMDQRARASAPGPLPPNLAVELMIPVVRALGCAHQVGIVHRDLKPENIFMTEAGPIKVLDFGVAKQLGAAEISTAAAASAPTLDVVGLTKAGALLGTLPYMAPEQWLAESADPRSDIWAVGVMLYELVIGEHPLAPLTIPRLSRVGDLDQPMPSVSDKRLDLGPLGAVIDRCLRKRKEERYDAAEELLAALLPLLEGRKALSLEEGESPFAGLSAFQEADAARFFGREREVAVLLACLRSQRLVALSGPAGAGKSSLVRAGVIPALKRSGERWEAFVLRPGQRPLAALADVLAQVPDAGDAEMIAAALLTQPGLLGARLRARCRKGGSLRHILLFVDQFEELYTLGIDAAERAAFVACLEGAADDASSPLRVMLSIRSDFLDRLAADRRLMTEVTRGLSFLPPMGRDALHEALTRPTLAAGYRFESEDMIVDMLAALDGARSPLPLLQFTASKLWEARDRERKLLTRDSYEKIGGVAGALSTHADAVLSGLLSEAVRLCRAVLLRLVTPERTRAVVSLSELRALAEDGGEVEQVVQHLADARLLLIEPSDERGGGTVEIVHESLIERWAKLKQWLSESEQDAQFLARLRAAAQQWEASDEAEGLLWRERAAEEAKAWLERRRAEQPEGAHLGLSKREERYLRAVVALSERARRRRRRVAGGVIATLGVTAVVVSYFAFQANQEAVQARNATRMATARELQNDPTTALALLREVEPRSAPRGWADLAWRALHSGLTRVVFSHPDGVQAIAWSPDGKRVVTASDDKLVRVWNADGTGEPLVVVLRGHEDGVVSAAFSPDGKRIVTASSDTTARVWSADGTGAPLVLRGHTAALLSAAFSPDGSRIATASLDTTARVWSADGAGAPMEFHGHEGAVASVAFSPDGKRLVTASLDTTARVWNVDGTGEPLVLRGHLGGVSGAVWSPDGKRIATASWDTTVRIWSADGAGQPLILRGHEGGVRTVAFRADGKRIVTASQDKTARVWNADGTGEPLIFHAHRDMVNAAAWSPDGKCIATASADNTARVWNSSRIGESQVLYGHKDMVNFAAWSPDGERVFTASADKTARVWSASAPGEGEVLRGPELWVKATAVSPDGKRVVAASWDKSVRVWKLDGTGEPLVLRGHDGIINAAAWSLDGTRVVTASSDKTAQVWSVDGGGEPIVLRGHDDLVAMAAFSPDGKRVVTASKDRTARVWNADGTGVPIVLRGHEGAVNGAAWSPDGKRVVTASADRTARVWSADGTGEPLLLRGHEGILYAAAWSPDGRHIVTVSADKTARVWSADGTGEPLILRGHGAAIRWAAWSPDGKRIVTASEDKTARVWDDLSPFRGADDPRLWTATPYCPSIERRVELLGMSEGMARTDQEICQRHVEQARMATGGDE